MGPQSDIATGAPAVLHPVSMTRNTATRDRPVRTT
jgi:hypothetical protein